MRFRLPSPRRRVPAALTSGGDAAPTAPISVADTAPVDGEPGGGAPASSGGEDVELRIAGMTCAGCATTIRDGLLQLPGVASAGVSPVTHRAALRPDGTVPAEDLEMLAEAAITGLGYRVVDER
ncbi:heavy metal-associated domain-containing protein [Demequina sp. NBRC 110054]|uniref:heavy-metal-associated domain-containing protein n=1 Tax=Demequina sp. NBRC 110054 TaxID=1570343 RepID=UPI000A04B594|nr:heavy metal-associated domain-containing protein [Demequina sp. NBRC 110054]